MAEFARTPTPSLDPRRAAGLARLAADAFRPATLTPGNIPPQVVKQTHVPNRGIVTSQVEFDRAGFAYDVTEYGPYTCNGAADGTVTHWTKVGANTGNLRLPLGDVDEAVYVWVWGQFGYKYDATATDDTIRWVACLYDDLVGSALPVVRANNISNQHAFADGRYYVLTYVGFFQLDPNDAAIQASSGYTGKGNWNVGIQQQYVGTQKVTHTYANRQSLVAFVSAFPPDGSSNSSVDGSLG